DPGRAPRAPQRPNADAARSDPGDDVCGRRRERDHGDGPPSRPDRPRCLATTGVGPRGCRTLPGDLVSPPRVLLDEHGDLARLSLPLQLVREADLGPAI